MLVLENLFWGLFGVFFQSVVFTFKGEKLKTMSCFVFFSFFTISKIYFKLIISNQTLVCLDDLELSVLEERFISVVILPKI